MSIDPLYSDSHFFHGMINFLVALRTKSRFFCRGWEELLGTSLSLAARCLRSARRASKSLPSFLTAAATELTSVVNSSAEAFLGMEGIVAPGCWALLACSTISDFLSLLISSSPKTTRRACFVSFVTGVVPYLGSKTMGSSSLTINGPSLASSN
jgi:hypothetical protein